MIIQQHKRVDVEPENLRLPFPNFVFVAILMVYCFGLISIYLGSANALRLGKVSVSMLSFLDQGQVDDKDASHNVGNCSPVEGLNAVGSLTTTPRRLPMIKEVLSTILKIQCLDRVFLNVPYEYNVSLPRFLYDLHPKLCVMRDIPDWGAETKLLGALSQAYLSNETKIVTFDDDRFYDADQIARMLRFADVQSDKVITIAGWDLGLTNRMPRGKEYEYPGFTDILLGTAGTVYRKKFLNEKAVFNVPDGCRKADDIWFSGHLYRRGVPIWIMKGKLGRDEEEIYATGRLSKKKHRWNKECFREVQAKVFWSDKTNPFPLKRRHRAPKIGGQKRRKKKTFE